MRPLFMTPTSGVSVTTNYVTSMISLVNAAWRGRYIERTQIYAKRRQVCLGVRKHLFIAQC